MRVLIGCAVAVLVAAQASASIVWAEDFASPDGNDASLLANGWTFSGRVLAADDSNRGGADGHDTKLEEVNGAGIPQHVSTYSYDYLIAAGTYDVTLTGWMKAYCSDWSWAPLTGQRARIELTIDDVLQDFAETDPDDVGAQDLWTAATLTYSGPIATKIDVHIISEKTTADFRIASAGRFDDIVLDVIPEPTTLGLLGLAGLAILRRKRD